MTSFDDGVNKPTKGTQARKKRRFEVMEKKEEDNDGGRRVVVAESLIRLLAMMCAVLSHR